MICRRDVQIGSLVRGKKTCRTKAEWDQIGLAAREGAQYLVDQNAGRPSGN